MKNITLAIEEALLEQSRQLAASRKTTLNALVRSLLATEVEEDNRIAEAKQGLKRLMDKSTGGMGPDYQWDRQEIYGEREDRMLSRHERPDLRRGWQET